MTEAQENLPPDLPQLLRAVVRSNGAPAVHTAQIVQMTGEAARHISPGGHLSADGRSADVLLVVLRGHFLASKASRPVGVPPPQGTFLTLLVDAATGKIGSFSLNDRDPDLAGLGAVRNIEF